MLNQILELLDAGNALSLEDLCQKTGGSKDLIKAQIEFLEQTRYLKRIDFTQGNNSSCQECENDCNTQIKQTCFPSVSEKVKR